MYECLQCCNFYFYLEIVLRFKNVNSGRGVGGGGGGGKMEFLQCTFYHLDGLTP